MAQRVIYNDERPHRLAGVVLLLVLGLVSTLVFLQFRGELSPTTKLTVMSDRSGLVLDRGAKVTYNGVPIGRVSDIEMVQTESTAGSARLTAEVGSDYLRVIPVNVRADVRASTIFGNKYLDFSAPDNPVSQRISSSDVITASTVTTEFQTLFETVTGIAERIDPVELNLTLSAAAEALTGLGERFGRSLVDGASVLDDANARMASLRAGTRGLADMADLYTAAGPDFWDALDNALTTIGTWNDRRDDLDAALLAAIGFADNASDTVSSSAPYLIRTLADLVPSARLLDHYSPAIMCTIRNAAEVSVPALDAFGGNGYSLSTRTSLVGAPNPYVYPDNLPRINARGGPGGAPGCWQPITRDFWPAPTLVVDTGASIAPYNHFELGQPLLNEFVWGRQVGENTINP